ncbi:MAG: S41 family peptidase [candidate division WOR-3 bacterium]|nr:MAG: S41 family peptidase [candidate division WOR-3 bacterium]
MIRSSALFIFTFMILFFPRISAAEPGKELSVKEQAKLIAEICEKVEDLYPFPDIGRRTSEAVNDEHNQGKYAEYTDPHDFANKMTIDLERFSNDTHFRMMYDPEGAAQVKKLKDVEVAEESLTAREARIERWNNYGFKELKILEGGIGYLDLRLFFAASYAGRIAVAAMNFLSECNAVIIDLRYNGGGWDDMVNLLLSYFAESGCGVMFNVAQSTLDSSYYASSTLPYVPGKRLNDIPVYVLISRSTASGAEAFAAQIKCVNSRAILVGETTAGAENPLGTVVIGDDYILDIPVWRKIYSAYDINWEGKGVEPDVEVGVLEALQTAHMEALEKLAEGATNEASKDRYQWALDGVRAVYEPLSIPREILESYAGNYGTRKVTFIEGELYYQYKDRTKRKMMAVTSDYFVVERYDFFRVKFIRKNDEVSVLREIFTDGSITNCARTGE